jgi:hypothetical protein
MNLQQYRKSNADFDRAFGALPAADRAKIRVQTAKKVFRW